MRAAHQFGDKYSAYAQYSYEEWTGQNQGVGGQALESGGYNSEYHEDDVVAHVDSTLSAVLLNQFSVVGEHDFNRHANVVEAPQGFSWRLLCGRVGAGRLPEHRIQLPHHRHGDLDARHGTPSSTAPTFRT